MKKFVALFISMLLMFTLLSACSDNSGDTSSPAVSTDVSTGDNQSTGEDESSAAPVEPYTDGRGVYITDFDKSEYNGRTFTIIVRGGDRGFIYQSDDFIVESEFYGDTLSIAVETRNRIIEEQYGVELEIIKDNSSAHAINSHITQDFSAGTQLYDAIMPVIPQLATYAKQGFLYDMTQLENMHLDAPWYDANANEAFSVGGRLFFTTGDITILNKVCTPSILFNRDYADELNMPNFYDLVRNNEWTYDKMLELAKSATYESDGETGMTGDDNWGMLTAYADVWTFFGGGGYTICAKDANDYPVFALDSETSVNALQKILTDLSNRGTWCCYAQDFDGDIWATSLDAFKQGRVLFRPSAFSAATKLRIAGTNFGILPIPLLTAEQDQYWSPCGAGEAVGIAIPLNAKDPEFSAYMVEALSCEAKNYLTPAYMEVNLKSKDAGAPDDLQMLEIIFDNIKYDIGDVYNFAQIGNMVSDMVKTGDTNIVSKLDGVLDRANAEIETLIEAFNNF